MGLHGEVLLDDENSEVGLNDDGTVALFDSSNTHC